MRLQVNQVSLVNRALQQASRDISNDARKEIRAIGELVADDAETLALSTISGMPRSPQWAEMRVGQNTELVYVVPWQRGVKAGRRKRPNLANLMLRRAMRPAKAFNQAQIDRRFDALVARVCGKFNGR